CVVVRCGGFYGPGTSLSSDPDSEISKSVRKRQFPLVGNGDGVWSFVHIADAAAATVAAAAGGARAGGGGGRAGHVPGRQNRPGGGARRPPTPGGRVPHNPAGAPAAPAR